MRIVAIFSLIVGIIANAPELHSATLFFSGGGGGPCAVMVVGSIEPGDDERFRSEAVRALKSGCGSVGQVYIYSPGGDVEAATGIGEQLRLLEAQTWGPVPHGPVGARSDQKRWCNFFSKGAKAGTVEQRILQFDGRTQKGDSRCSCHSACFLIWAGGVSRHGHAIGLHRPRFDPTHYARLDTVQARARYDEAVRRARAYLTRMDVPEPIIAKMFSVDSQNVSYLTHEESKLLAELPYLEELLLARCKKVAQAPTRWSSSCVWEVVEELGKEAAKRYLSRYGR